MKKKIILLIIVLLWMGVIFYFSSKNSEESTSQSQGIINKTNIVEMYENKHEANREEVLKNIDRHFRKVAHAINFMILAVFVCMFFNEYKLDIKKVILFAFLVCCLYAVSDEIHQYFVPGRSAEVRDIIIDNMGASIGYFIFFMAKRRKK